MEQASKVTDTTGTYMCTCTLCNDAWECVRGIGLEAINIFTVCFGRKEEWEGREGER